MDLLGLTGQKLGQYELKELIGKGGMSAVYRGHQPSLNRNVAVKVLAGALAADPTYARRFDNEAKTVATLEHNNIIPVYDYGRRDDLSYIVMRLLSGGTLGERIEYRVDRKLPLPSFGEAVTLLNEMAKALSYAHSRGVIHRDIKASNVMFDGQGDPYLVDFGIAQVIKSNVALTAENQTIGTPTYMAPEQWLDESLTPATDQYALAVLMFYTLTGRLPFYGSNTPALMQKHLNEPAPEVHTIRAEIPAQASNVLLRALSKEPENRYLTVKAFAESFEAAFSGELGTKTDFFAFNLSVSEFTAPHRAATVQAEQAASAPTMETPVQKAVPPEDYAPPVQPPSSAPPAPVSAPPPSRPPAAPSPQPQPAPTQRNSFIRGVGIGVAILAVLTVIGIIAFNAAFGIGTQAPPVAGTIAPSATPASGVIRINPTPGNDAPQATAITPVRGGTAVAVAPVEVSGSGVLFQGTAGDVIRAVAVNPNGVIYSGHSDGNLRAWVNGTAATPLVQVRHTGVINDIDMSADGTVMVTGSDDRSVLVWNGLTTEYVGALQGHTSAVRGVAVSPDGTRAVSVSEDGTVRLWDVPAGTQIAILRQSDRRFLDVDFSPDGQWVAIGGEPSGAIYLYDVGSQSLLRTLRGHSSDVRSLEFSPDGTQLASGSTDDTIRIWNVADGVIVTTLRGHNNDVWRVRYSPNGAQIASGGRDNNLRLWNVSDRSQTAGFDDHGAWVIGVAFAPEGNVIVTGGGDGSVRTWQVGSQD